MGLAKREDRPIGVAVRRYYHSPVKHDDDYLESWLELRSREGGDTLLPGYGWIFGMGDGRVNVGLGVLNSSSAFGKTNYRTMLTDWLSTTPPEWGMNDEANADGPIMGAALPMGFNRVPHYTAGRAARRRLRRHGQPVQRRGHRVRDGVRRDGGRGRSCRRWPARPVRRGSGRWRNTRPRCKPRFGGYYRLGGWFVKLIGNPQIMRVATKHGMPHPTLMRFVLKLLANLTDPRDGDAMDRIINTLTKVAPAV